VSTAAPVETGDLTWREQKKLLTRKALHDAARRLVLASGLAAVTVEEICAAASVSPRTFFNYFPSKSAAALGLPDLRIADAERERFLEGRTGNVVHDLCEVLAAVLLASGDRLSDKESKHDLVARRPELQPELHAWMAGLRRQVLELAALRLAAPDARAAAALVLAAFMDAVQSGEARQQDLADRLWSSIRRMCAVAGCEAPTA
jgi:AcrR family transcriptional regulator